MNFIKIAQNHSFTKMRMEIQYTCNFVSFDNIIPVTRKFISIG